MRSVRGVRERFGVIVGTSRRGSEVWNEIER